MVRAGILAALLAAACVAAPGGAADPAVTAVELRAHVEWLADDAREGRRAGTEAERIAAAYVAQQFARAGLQPAGDEGGWFQEFEIPHPPQPGPCSLTMRGRAVAVLDTLACSASGTVAGPLAIASEVGADLNGAIALVRRPSAGGDAAVRDELRRVAQAGAIGAVLNEGADPRTDVREDPLRFASVPGSVPLPVVVVPDGPFEDECLLVRNGAPVEAVLTATVVRTAATSRNVLGLLPGRGPELLVVGAHYDHLGWGGEGSLAPGAREIHNGADDNASGTAVLIELAEEWAAAYRAAAADGALPEVGVLFAAWGAEESGLLGSSHWVGAPTVALAQVRANLNLDMVGRAAGGAITVGSAETAAAFAPAVAAAQARLAEAGMTLHLALAQGALPGGGGSDHMSFHRAGVPALFFFSGLHADYHKPGDDAALLDVPRMREVAAAVGEVMKELQRADRAQLAYLAPAAGPGPGRAAREGGRQAGVWFGSIPDYAAAPEGGGMQIAGTSPGSPAEKAGLQAGDVIRKVGERSIGDIYDFMDALAGFRNGQTVAVEVLRGGQSVTLPLTFFARPSGS